MSSIFTSAVSLLTNSIMPAVWTTTKAIAVVLLLINIKTLPLTWHFRFYRSLIYHFFVRRRITPAPAHLFSPITTTSRASTYECDLNGHKSNSTYFSDLDIARTHLVCHLTKSSFKARRLRGDPVMYVALAGVTALFRREIPPFKKYEISSRVLGWDRKWVFVSSHFVSLEKNKKTGEKTIYASCLSKYVFKSGRMTVPPEVVFQESGLVPARPEGAEEMEGSGGSSGVETPVQGLKEGKMGEEKLEAVMRKMVKEDLERKVQKEDGYWTWEKIEEERKRGLAIAQGMMALDGLDAEFREGTEEGLEKVGRFFGAI
ncbi:HotDog domain-containing protein [Pyronema omphalodes]|nr:HotDog domain-containing protein [Pyronema omphalodes]